RADYRTVTDLYARHEDRLRADPDVIADDCIAGRPIAVRRSGKSRDLRHEEERKSADPVVPVALVAGHDESSARADRAEAADDQLVRAFVRKKETGAIVEAVAVIVA